MAMKYLILYLEHHSFIWNIIFAISITYILELKEKLFFPFLEIICFTISFNHLEAIINLSIITHLYSNYSAVSLGFFFLSSSLTLLFCCLNTL